MTFDAILAQVLDVLQHQGQVAYRALRMIARYCSRPPLCFNNDCLMPMFLLYGAQAPLDLR